MISSPHPILVKVAQSRAENIQLDFSIFWLGRGGICDCQFFEKLLPVLYLETSDETRLSNVYFFDINYLLFKIIEVFSQKGVQAFSGLACEWVIPEKIDIPTTEGMLENLTGEARVNSSGNLVCTHFSFYESLPKGYNECI